VRGRGLKLQQPAEQAAEQQRRPPCEGAD